MNYVLKKYSKRIESSRDGAGREGGQGGSSNGLWAEGQAVSGAGPALVSGNSIPGRGNSICKGPEEGDRAWHTVGSASSLLWLRHRIGVGVRSALFLAIPLWPDCTHIFNFYSFITISRN